MCATSFTELVGCALPLQLAGMGGIGTSAALPAAVSEAGGLGMIGAAGLAPTHLAALCDQVAELTSGPFGVNFLMPFVDAEAVAVAAERARLVEFFYGDPDPSLVAVAHAGGALAAWQVGSRQEALAAAAAGCDVTVVQGREAGGHVRGTQPLAVVLAEVLAVVEVPVIAAGGIGTARDVRAALEAGAAGVRCGTRFLAAHESTAHPEYVEALIRAGSGDTVLTDAFSYGWDAPHRVLRSAVAALEASTEEYVAIADGAGERIHRASTSPPTSDVRGDVAAMAMYAGTSVSAVRARSAAGEIVAELCAELPASLR
jgi:nitronate monooxygenase